MLDRRVKREVGKEGSVYFCARREAAGAFYGMQATRSQAPACNLLELRRLTTSGCASHLPPSKPHFWNMGDWLV